MYGMSKKYWPILYSNYLYKMGHYFLGRRYVYTLLSSVADPFHVDTAPDPTSNRKNTNFFILFFLNTQNELLLYKCWKYKFKRKKFNNDFLIYGEKVIQVFVICYFSMIFDKAGPGSLKWNGSKFATLSKKINISLVWRIKSELTAVNVSLLQTHQNVNFLKVCLLFIGINSTLNMS